MSSNTAAWQSTVGAKLDIKPSPYTAPKTTQIVVKNHAVAVNPADGLLQDQAVFPWLTYPTILGTDVGGEVVQVGDSVSDFKIGDRVLGQSVGFSVNNAAEGAFQHYTVVESNMASKIPQEMSYAQACVIPLGFGTAACGLFQKGYLELNLPTLNSKPTGKTMLIWGGASSVGCNGIQLAKAAGYHVVATASPKNFDYLKKLGAEQVFDYNSSTIVQDIASTLSGKSFAGVLHTAGSSESCFAIASKASGNKIVASTLPPPSEKPSGVHAAHIFGSTLKDNEVGRAVYSDFLPHALANGSFIAAPEPEIVGNGLESLQNGLDTLKKGVSAKKVVITL